MSGTRGRQRATNWSSWRRRCWRPDWIVLVIWSVLHTLLLSSVSWIILTPGQQEDQIKNDSNVLCLTKKKQSKKKTVTIKSQIKLLKWSFWCFVHFVPTEELFFKPHLFLHPLMFCLLLSSHQGFCCRRSPAQRKDLLLEKDVYLTKSGLNYCARNTFRLLQMIFNTSNTVKVIKN